MIERPSKRITDTELRILIGDLEANGKARSITQNWQLSALKELQERRAAVPPSSTLGESFCE